MATTRTAAVATTGAKTFPRPSRTPRYPNLRADTYVSYNPLNLRVFRRSLEAFYLDRQIYLRMVNRRTIGQNDSY
jgi:hypothetical protein